MMVTIQLMSPICFKATHHIHLQKTRCNHNHNFVFLVGESFFHAHSLCSMQELLRLLEVQSLPSPVHHAQRTPARQPSWSGGNHSNSFNSLNANPSGVPGRYHMVTGMSSSYVPEWRSELHL